MKISIITPALNEEKNILSAIDNCLAALREFNIDGEIIIVNDGSVDSTPLLVRKRADADPGIIRMISHNKPMGLGFSFWDGLDHARGQAAVMIPGDNENDPREILRYHALLSQVDMVIPFVYNKEVRPFLRKIISSFFCFFINMIFRTNFHYTNGTNLYRTEILKELKTRSNSFFFQADILVRLARQGYLFAEVPCRLDVRQGGESKLVSLRSVRAVLKDCLRLFRDCYFKQKSGAGGLLITSASFRRKNKN